MFSGSACGAESSCTIYSPIETARQNGLDPFAYLHYVFSAVPHISSADDWDTLLPHQLDQSDLIGALPSPLQPK